MCRALLQCGYERSMLERGCSLLALLLNSKGACEVLIPEVDAVLDFFCSVVWF